MTDKIRGIVNRKVKENVTMYKVKFKGDKEDTWVPAEDVPADMVAKFEAKRGAKMDKRPREDGDEQSPAPKAVKTEAAPAPAPSPAAPVPADLQLAVSKVMEKYLKTNGIETLTKKKVRRLLEADLGQPELSMEERKAEIGKATDVFVANFQKDQEEAGDDDSESEEDSSSGDDEEPAKKEPEKKKAVMTLKTKSGDEAPKKVAALQASAMKVSYFEANAEKLSVDVLGNIATGEARSFTSGNRGWHVGGKVEVMVGKKKLWAQLGLNLTILGSKTWS